MHEAETEAKYSRHKNHYNKDEYSNTATTNLYDYPPEVELENRATFASRGFIQ